MSKSKSKFSCCSGCSFLIVAIIIVVVIAGVLFASKYITISQIHLADKEGILHNFDSEKYSKEDTFNSQQMGDWKVWDVIQWVIKSGNYSPS